MKLAALMPAVALLTISTLPAQTLDATTPTAPTTVTNVSGTIAQLNYGTNGQVQGFLIGTNTLLSFPTTPCGGITTLGAVGNSITYSGSEITASSGFESVTVSSFTNNSTKVTYTAPTTTSTTPTAATAYGPTTGKLTQLNYSTNGTIDGFLFLPNGSSSLIFVSTGTRASGTLATVLTVNGTLTVTGTTTSALSACSSTETLETVDAVTLVIGNTTIIIAGGGQGGGLLPLLPFVRQ